mgnify:CR=1 FL=1
MLCLSLPLLAPAVGGTDDFVLEGVHGLPSLAALDFSPTGSLLYAGGTDDIVRVFDGETLALLHTWGHRGARIDTVAVSPDGSSVAAGDQDGVVTFYATTDGRELSRWGGNGRPVNGLAWQGDRIGMASLHGPIRVMEASGRPKATIEGPGERFLRVEFALGCERVAAAGRGGDIRVWETETGRLMQTLRLGDVETTQMAFNADCTRIAGQDWDGHVRVWDLESGALLATLTGSGVTGGLALTDEGVIGRSPEDQPQMWRLDGTVDHRWSAPPRWTGLPPDEGDGDSVPAITTRRDLAVARSGRIADAYGATLRLWNADGSLRASQDTGLAAITDVEVHSPRVYAATENGRVVVRHALGGEMIGVMTLPGAPVVDIAVDPKNRLVAVAGPDNLVRVWEPLSGQQAVTLFGHKEPVHSVDWSLNGQLASASSEPDILVWDVSGRKVARRLRAYVDGIGAFAWSSNHLIVWPLVGPGLKSLSDVNGLVQSTSLLSHEGARGAVSRSGKTVASTDGTDLALVNPYTGVRLAFDHAPVRWPTVAFSHDGKLVAGGTEGGSVQILNVATGALVVSLRGHSGPVTSVAFSPDGLLVASGSADGTVRVWSRP